MVFAEGSVAVLLESDEHLVGAISLVVVRL